MVIVVFYVVQKMAASTFKASPRGPVYTYAWEVLLETRVMLHPLEWQAITRITTLNHSYTVIP